MSLCIRKPTICIFENQGVTAQLIRAFVFTTLIMQSLFFSSHLLWLHRLVVLDLVRNLNCWFSHECEGLKVVVVFIPDGASEDSITDVETSRYGSEDVIPLDLRLSYRIHNGQRLAADNSEITPG